MSGEHRPRRTFGASIATRWLVLLTTGVLAMQTARGQDCATPMTETELRALTRNAQTAIDEEDVAAHGKVLDTLEARIPCLVDAIPSRPWADFLVTEILVRYADETGDWQQPMRTVDKLVPDHPDVPGWLRDEYVVPPDPIGEPIPIPKGALVVVDGRVQAGKVPPLVGLHVVQVFRDDVWRSMLTRNRAFPRDWLEPDPAPVPRPEPTEARSSWGSLGIGGAFGTWSQRPETGSSSGLLDDRDFPGTGLVLATHGQQTLAQPVGVFWAADGALQSSAGSETGDSRRFVPFGSGFVGASLFDQPLSVLLGGGAVTTRIVTADAEQTVVLPHYFAGLSFRSADPIGLDIMAGGGWGPWGAHAQARTGATFVDLGPVGLRVGARGSYAVATLLDFEPENRPVIGRSRRWEGGLEVGISWGVAE
jgi:hypothetical protein